MDIEKLREIAEDLIKELDGIISDENIDGVITVFNGVIKGRDIAWEEHLVDETNEILMGDNTTCSNCGHPIQVIRQECTIYVDA